MASYQGRHRLAAGGGKLEREYTKKVPRDRSKVFLNLRRIREEATTTDAFFFQYSRRGVFIWSMWRVSFDIKSFHKSHF